MSDPIDPYVLKGALIAFKKKIKSMRLDDETSSSRGMFSGGKVSGVVAITPPSQFPREVWEELARQGRLIENNGCYQLPKY
jgi:hypothetical protein